MNIEKNDVSWINFANVVSALAVVILHTNSCFWRFSSTERYWKTANIIECFFYFAVPVFFMISGATLLDFNKRYGIREYFKRRLEKTVIPYLFWSILGLFFQIYYLKSISITDVDAKYFFNNILTGNMISIYWFFIPLFGIYLLIPLFAAVQDKNKKNIFVYLVVAAFFIDNLVPFIINIFHIPISWSMSVMIGKTYSIYLLVGYLASHYEVSKRWRYVSYIGAVLGLLMHICGTYSLSMQAGEIVQVYKGYLNVPCILYSTGVFIFFRYEGGKIMKSSFCRKLIDFLKQYTFSCYLMHWFIIKILIRTFSLDERSIVYRLLSPFVIVAINVLVTYFLRKLPFFRKVLP